MKRTVITCMITSMITNTKAEINTESRQTELTESKVNTVLNDIDTDGFETEIYYINTVEDYNRSTEAVLHRDGKIIIEVVQAVVVSDNGDARMTVNDGYIKYNAEDVKTGDMMETVLVYNPATDYDDDVMFRADTFLKQRLICVKIQAKGFLDPLAFFV